ncbi:MAG: YezD family protein [Planctomycetota bacterium]|nr:YezD family protein [Planctomycetota bacterium]
MNPVSAIVEALEGLKFGQLMVVVHDGAVVQIDKTEPRRLDRKPRAGDGEG